MLVLGINKGSTLSGKPLRYGGAAIVKDGELATAILEERVSRQKWAGGYSASLAALLKTGGGLVGRKGALRLDDFDQIAVSSCCENEAAAAQGHALEGNQRLTTVNHHLSHTSLAYYSSPFDTALV